MKEKTTECECPLAGYCNRHEVTKSAHLHKLCQTNQTYFDKWEQCQGPGQQNSQCSKKEIVKIEVEEKKEPKLPSLVTQASNLIKSATKHIVSGGQSVSSDKQQARLDICKGCQYFIESQNRCGHCGCFLGAKTKWKTSTCPIGKW